MQNYDLTDEQSQILDTTRKFVADVAGPAALDHDEHRNFVRGSIDGIAELGLFGLPVAEEAGGFGLGMLSFVVAIEELAKGCGSTARPFSGRSMRWMRNPAACWSGRRRGSGRSRRPSAGP